MSKRVLEYIIRAIDSTKAGTDSASANAKNMADKVETSSSSIKDSLLGIGAKFGLIVAAFRGGWEIGERINAWVSPIYRAAAAFDKVSESIEKTKKWIESIGKAFKEELSEETSEYERQERQIERTTAARIALANASKTTLSPENAKILVDSAQERKTNRENEIAALEKRLALAEQEKANAAKKVLDLDKNPIMKSIIVGAGFGGVEAHQDVVDKEKTEAAKKNGLAADKIADLKLDSIRKELEKAKEAFSDVANDSAVAVSALHAASENERNKSVEAVEGYIDDLAETIEDMYASADEYAKKKRLEQIKQDKQSVKDELTEQGSLKDPAKDRLEKAKDAAKLAWDEFKSPELRAENQKKREADAEAEIEIQKASKRIAEKIKYKDKLTDYEESVQNVLNARKEEKSAQSSLDGIEKNTKDLAKKMEELMKLK